MTVLHAVMAPRDATAAPVDGLREVDLYDLPQLLDGPVAGIYLADDVDQEFLFDERARLEAFVSGGGRLVINGHVQRIFLDGLTRWRKRDFRSPKDLVLTRINEHPVWDGIDPRALLYSTGRSGPVPFAELEQTGVAGFYGRGCYLGLPDSATVIHGVGRSREPLDYEYRLGAGRVLVHGGNDLLEFAEADRGTTRLRTQLIAWLEGQ